MIQSSHSIPGFLRNFFFCWVFSLAAAFSAVVNSPSQSAVDAAKAVTLIRYSDSYTNGAFTNGAWFGGASIVLAVASHAGNTTADARLLQQIRYSIVGENTIRANSGYPAQHERHVTGMFAIARHTPRIWDQLTAAEKGKIDLIMKAGLVANAFTTSDNNPFILAGSQQYTLDADSNLDRSWNPNYREGMLGGVLVGMAYFGGPAATESILKNYNHSAFVADLAAKGLTNPHKVFNWKTANPTSSAPTGSQIESAVRNYEYFGSTLADYMEMYMSLVNDTYGRNVNSGLNGGAGIDGSGKIASGAATLPNPGVAGMLKEFDARDANGARSSLEYCYDGFRPHQTNQLVLIIGGYWPRGSADANSAAAKMKIGNTDLWYKIEKGYYSYSKGKSQGLQDLAFINGRGFSYVRSLWEDVLRPYHDASVDTDGDGTSDSNEIRLGLNPANPSSRFAASLQGGTLRWPGAAGLTFVVQRSASGTAVSWQTIATLPGIAGSNSYRDPAPPAGMALYRIGLNP